jgi:hypothetical protein
MLDATVTVGDVVDRLRKPVEYLRQVLDALHVAQRRHPGAVLRIGRKGDGQFPNYRTDAGAEDRTLIAAYNGRTYGALTGKDSLAEENWSQASLSLDELRRVMRETAQRYSAAA